VSVALEGIRNILKSGQRGLHADATNPFAVVVVMAGGIDRMVALQLLSAAAQIGEAAQAVERLGSKRPPRLERRAGLEHQHLQPGLGQHHGRHAAGGT